MKIALNVVQQSHLRDGLEWWRLADEAGIDAIALPDSPALARELYVTSALCARETSRCTIVSGVTNPVSRDPSVTAAAVATLEEIAPGRIALGIGTGDSALWGVGRKPAKIARMREYILAVKALVRGEEAFFEGRRFQMRWRDWTPFELPVHVAVAGPKVLAMACEVADGMVLSMGCGPENIAYVNALVADGCASAGRDPGEIEQWWNTEVVFGTSVEEARSRRMGVGTEWLTMGSLEGKQIPPELVEPLKQFNRDIHNVAAEYQTEGREAMLIRRAQELGLYEWLLSRAPGLWGTPADIASRLREYESAGMDHWMIYVGRSEHERMAELRLICKEVLPLVRR